VRRTQHARSRQIPSSTRPYHDTMDEKTQSAAFLSTYEKLGRGWIVDESRVGLLGPHVEQSRLEVVVGLHARPYLIATTRTRQSAANPTLSGKPTQSEFRFDVATNLFGCVNEELHLKGHMIALSVCLPIAILLGVGAAVIIHSRSCKSCTTWGRPTLRGQHTHSSRQRRTVGLQGLYHWRQRRKLLWSQACAGVRGDERCDGRGARSSQPGPQPPSSWRSLSRQSLSGLDTASCDTGRVNDAASTRVVSGLRGRGRRR
jgi:hypothetical protein